MRSTFFKYIIGLMAGLGFAVGSVHLVYAAAFSDFSYSPLYLPATDLLHKQNIIIGDTLGGKPVGTLRPDDHIRRAEFAKISTLVSLLEAGHTDLLDLPLDEFTLRENTLLTSYYTNGPFPDVPDKDPACADDPDNCIPWYTQYVNYTAAHGITQGFADGNFYPDRSILRIHAVKMAVISNYSRLLNDPRIQNRPPNCLASPQVQDYILQNNGNSQTLLDYALLADRLDIFGNHCQAFTDNGISLYDTAAIADYLQKPLTRKEIARYFSLTTTIPRLTLDPASDPTVDSGSEYTAPYTSTLEEEKTGLPNQAVSSYETTVAPSRFDAEDEDNIYSNTDPVYSGAQIEECGYIPLDRDNTREMILGCIATLRRKGKTNAEIEILLYSAGFLSYVQDFFTSVVVNKQLVADSGFNPALFCLFNPGICEKARLLQEEAERLKARAEEIKVNLNNKFAETGSALRTCRYGTTGKARGTEEYNIVLAWCNAHGVTEEDLEPKKIDTVYYATGKVGFDMKFIPNMDNGPSIWRVTDKMGPEQFRIDKLGNTDSYSADPNRDVYIVIHGWSYGSSGHNSESWIVATANALLRSDPTAQILLIRWEDISNKITPYKAAKWIGSIADAVDEAVDEWGANPERTHVIGFSLGGIMTGVLSKKLGPVNAIGLDPAYFPLDYRIDYQDTRFLADYGGFNKDGACFVADASWSGSEKTMHTCREGYLIDYSGNFYTDSAAIAYGYAEYVIDEAVEDFTEYLADKGFTYVVDGVSDGTHDTIPIVKLYQIANGQWQEVAVSTARDKACKRIDATTKLPYFCEYAIDEILEHLVTYHKNVPETYKTIISNPFNGNLLSPADIASRKGGYAPFANMDLSHFMASDKTANGIIYTERNMPTKLKYLQVEPFGPSTRYTLYGNAQPNKFECYDEKECVIYGYWNTDRYGKNLNSVGDEFKFDGFSANHSIEDFRFHEDPDKIIISGVSKDQIKVPEGEAVIRLEYYVPTYGGKTLTQKNLTLEGHSYEEVRGWLKIAKANMTIERELWGKTPIVIN